MFLLCVVTASALAQSTTKEVFLTVSVTNQHGQIVPGLEKERFTVSEKKTNYQITSFSNNDQPTSITILVDMSGSMKDEFPIMEEWIEHFIRAANHANEYLIVAFDAQPRVLCNWRCGEKELAQVLGSIAKAQPKQNTANTALFDACAFAVAELKARSLSKRAIVLLSDGMDNVSRTSLRELHRSLQLSDAMVYAIGLLGRGAGGTALGMEGQGILDELSSTGGGEAFYANARDQLDRIANHIGFELEHQYILGFKMDATADRQFHIIKVKVTPPPAVPPDRLHLTIRHRPGLYVP
jgi:VWFA-related protein